MTAVLKPTCPYFQVQVNAFCILNRVLASDLVGYGPTELWIRIFSKIRNASARATFLFRLLREKPELIVGSMQQSISNNMSSPMQGRHRRESSLLLPQVVDGYVWLMPSPIE